MSKAILDTSNSAKKTKNLYNLKGVKIILNLLTFFL